MPNRTWVKVYRAQEELKRRLESEKQNKELQTEIGVLRNMMMSMSFMNPSMHNGTFRQAAAPMTFPCAAPPSQTVSTPIEKTSIESIVLPEALQVKARRPKN